MKKTKQSTRYRKLLKELKLARMNAKLTQTQVAAKFGAHASFVSKCESGERRIDVIELTDFCKIYGVKFEDFLKRVEL